MHVDPSDITAIIKSATDVAKTGGELVGALKLTDIGRAMLGEATEEFAESLRDRVRLYRFGNQLKAIKKAEKMVADAGFSPKAVPIKILFPLLEGASLEENESLHDMWAALLANAASPGDASKVRPGFISTLKQMAPDEAALLKALFDQRTGPSAGTFNRPFDIADLLVAHASVRSPADSDPLAFHTCIQSLQAQQLVEQIPDPKHTGYLIHSYALTMRGLALVYACLPPLPKKGV